MINPMFINVAYTIRMLMDSEIRRRIREIMEMRVPPGLPIGTVVGYPGSYIRSGMGVSHHKIMLIRYIITSDLSKGLDVVDAGCGLGWGSYLISANAKTVLGVDIDARFVKYANEKWVDSNLVFETMDILSRWSFENGSIDVVSMMEMIEHVKVDDLKKCLSEIFRVLKGNGLLIGSSGFTSDPKWKKSMLKNPKHLHIYSSKEFEVLLSDVGFVNPKVYHNWMFIARKPDE